MQNYETELFIAMQNVGKGNYADSFANLVLNHRDMITEAIQTEIDFLADAVALADITVTDDDTKVVIECDAFHYIVTNMNIDAGTANVVNVTSGVAIVEYCDGLLSVIVAGEVLFIIPFTRKRDR